jgi:hypothetical protein
LPPEIEHADVETVDVTEQARVPVVVTDAAVPVVVELEVLWLVVDEAVDAELVVDSVVVVESDVVVADVLATVAVEDFAVVLFAVDVVLAVVVEECVVLPVVESAEALLFNSFSASCTSNARQSCANHTASAVASATSHPPEIKHRSISSNCARSAAL